MKKFLEKLPDGILKEFVMGFLMIFSEDLSKKFLQDISDELHNMLPENKWEFSKSHPYECPKKFSEHFPDLLEETP